MSDSPLPRSFYDREVALVARELVGKRLVRNDALGCTAGRIVEVEAYLPQDDPACHAAKGRTRRNRSMFGPPGRAYVYAIHSRWCVNAVTDAEGVGCAVLIRAIEPLEGLEFMHRRRGIELVRDLARGPGRLCEAMDIGRELDGSDLTTGGALAIHDGELVEDDYVATTTRIGVTSAHELPLRFVLADNRFTSGKRVRKP